MSDEPWGKLLARGRAQQRLVFDDLYGARSARPVAIPPDLHPRLLEGLDRLGIKRLYSHQAEALQAAFDGHWITTTATASGKSLCFTLPTLEILLGDPAARALYVYPTKALAQDQARSLHAFGLGDALRPAIYDGDTPRGQRAAIRRQANVLLTNPDMLHVGILPHHHSWDALLANLAFVVLDEAHVYRGVFGSQVAGVLRRLRRAAALHGSSPHFLLTSATIANPLQLAQRLTGLGQLALIARDGSPAPARRVAVWNPPLLDAQLGARASTLYEAAEVLCDLVQAQVRTICFMKSRRGVELILRHARNRLGSRLGARIAPYRAGYTPAQRREIEARLVDGELLAVVATDALELGIDIGRLDAAICVTFPGTVASLRQMWGRAGRRERGLALYIAGEDALDQFFARHPDEFLARPVEAAILDPFNLEIYDAQLLCAAHEAPLCADDEPLLGEPWLQGAQRLADAGLLRRRAATFVPARADDYPAARVALRSASADTVALLDVSTGEVLGSVEALRALQTVHQGAVYLHLGSSYLVVELDLDARRALLEPFAGDYYTQTKREITTLITRLADQRETHGVRLSSGEVVYSDTVIGYQRKRLHDGEALDFQALEAPTVEFHTRALWYELDGILEATLPTRRAREGARAQPAIPRARQPAPGAGPSTPGAPRPTPGAGPFTPGAGPLTPGAPRPTPGAGPFPPDLLLGALHALEHAQIAVLPLIAMCDRWDLGGLSTNAHPQTGGPTIFIYEGHPGGVGLTRRGFDRFDRLVADAARLIGECPCEHGCPSCVQSPKCGNLNEPLSKAGALELARRMSASAQPEVA